MAIDWVSVRKDYEESGVSAKVLGCRYGLSPQTVIRRARKEGWVAGSPKDEPAGCAAEGPRVPSSGSPPNGSDDDHVALWLEVRKRLSKALEHDDAGRCLEELKAAKLAGEVLSNVVKGRKEARELTECDVSDIYEEAQEIVREMETATIPPGPGPALEGE